MRASIFFKVNIELLLTIAATNTSGETGCGATPDTTTQNMYLLDTNVSFRVNIYKSLCRSLEFCSQALAFEYSSYILTSVQSRAGYLYHSISAEITQFQ